MCAVTEDGTELSVKELVPGAGFAGAWVEKAEFSRL